MEREAVVSYVLEFDEDDSSCVVLTPNSPKEFRDLIYNSQIKFVDFKDLLLYGHPEKPED